MAVHKPTSADLASIFANKEKTPEETSEKHSSGGAEAEGENVQYKDESGTTLPCPTPISQTPPSPTDSDQIPISTLLPKPTRSQPQTMEISSLMNQQLNPHQYPHLNHLVLNPKPNLNLILK